MTRAPKLYIIAYDVCDARRLRKVYKIMRGFGDHIQYSVFRCVLSDTQLARLKARLDEVIAPSEDQVLFVPLGSTDAKRAWSMSTLGLPLTHPERIVNVL